jgi:integrase/recombinase XerD
MKGVSEKNKAAYQSDLKQFENWYGNDYDWCNKPVILGFIIFAYKTYKPRTAKRKIASSKAFFHYLRKDETI